MNVPADAVLSRHSRPPEYNRWAGMVQRCEDKNHASYPRYGGRGISVCPAWRDSYVVFLSDVGCAPSADHSIERIDNNGNYEPGNVRWATRIEQGRNKRNNRTLLLDGRRVTQAELAEISGLSQGTVQRRMDLGWSAERIISQPAALGSGGRVKTHCPRGHPYDAENTYVYRGKRHCRRCGALKMKRRRLAAGATPRWP